MLVRKKINLHLKELKDRIQMCVHVEQKVIRIKQMEKDGEKPNIWYLWSCTPKHYYSNWIGNFGICLLFSLLSLPFVMLYFLLLGFNHLFFRDLHVLFYVINF